MGLGYRNDTGRSLEFYEDFVPESDIQKVKEMTAELLVAKLETEHYERTGGPPMDVLQPPPREPVKQPSIDDIYGSESIRIHDSGEQMASTYPVTQGRDAYSTATTAQHSVTVPTDKVSLCCHMHELRALVALC